jgi:hypothetical protein
MRGWCVVSWVWQGIATFTFILVEPIGLIFHILLQEPRILNIEPTYGLVSGGTKLTIIGKYMNAGSQVTASVGGLPCQVIR